jgi:hypothetical protein
MLCDLHCCHREMAEGNQVFCGDVTTQLQRVPVWYTKEQWLKFILLHFHAVSSSISLKVTLNINKGKQESPHFSDVLDCNLTPWAADPKCSVTFHYVTSCLAQIKNDKLILPKSALQISIHNSSKWYLTSHLTENTVIVTTITKIVFFNM